MSHLHCCSDNVLEANSIGCKKPSSDLCDRTAPMPMELLSVVRTNGFVRSGNARIGAVVSLFLIVSNESCCSLPYTKGAPFLVNSVIGFINVAYPFMNFLKNDEKPMKDFTPFLLIGGCRFVIELIFCGVIS